MFAGSYTRAQIAERTGLPDDVLAHWTKEGLILPDTAPLGRGRHKLFAAREINKAALLASLREFRCSISALRWFSTLIDQAFAYADLYPQLDSYKFYYVSHAIRDVLAFKAGKPVKLFGLYDEKGDVRLASSLEEIVNREMREFSSEEFKFFRQAVLNHLDEPLADLAFDVASDLSERSITDERTRLIWLVWPEGDGWRFYTDSDENFSGLRVFPTAAILLHVSRILRRAWGLRHVNSWGEEVSNG